MQNGKVPIAELSAADIADHFGRYWANASANPGREQLDERAQALVTYMTGFGGALSLITQENIIEPMSALMAEVALLDLRRVQAEEEGNP